MIWQENVARVRAPYSSSADGRWCSVLNLGSEGGRRRRKCIYGFTEGAVQNALLRARADQAAGLPLAVEHQTVAQFLTDWLENSARPSARPAPYRSYEQTIRNHLIPELGRLPLRKLEPQHVRAMLNRKLAAGLSARSVCYLRVMLRAALNQARKWNLVARNVAELVDPPKCERFKIEPLSPLQARVLLESVKGEKLEALYAVALACGLRMGEILGLRWQDIDLGGGRLTVSHALQRQKGRGLVLAETKTDRSRRTIGLPPAAGRHAQVASAIFRSASPLARDGWTAVWCSRQASEQDRNHATDFALSR